jgi:hypothetical protein
LSGIFFFLFSYTFGKQGDDIFRLWYEWTNIFRFTAFIYSHKTYVQVGNHNSG